MNTIPDNTDREELCYPLMEDFLTIQGEGVYSGYAAWFIRLAGCDVGCWWCDVKESWDESAHPVVSLEKIGERAAASGAPIVVVTGGEPLLHNLNPLTDLLHSKGMRVHLETSGSSPLTGSFDWITLSPKRFKKPLPEIYDAVDELKIVVLKNRDLRWAEEMSEFCPAGVARLLQPEWETPESIELITEYIKRNPQWRVSLQTHKFMNIP
ncbi:MAG: 7-carboxy-7-deazaguanine synthase QueE [Balneolaceae bacterium]